MKLIHPDGTICYMRPPLPGWEDDWYFHCHRGRSYFTDHCIVARVDVPLRVCEGELAGPRGRRNPIAKARNRAIVDDYAAVGDGWEPFPKEITCVCDGPEAMRARLGNREVDSRYLNWFLGGWDGGWEVNLVGGSDDPVIFRRPRVWIVLAVLSDTDFGLKGVEWD